jgi:hypothetical protein
MQKSQCDFKVENEMIKLWANIQKCMSKGDKFSYLVQENRLKIH